MSADNSIPKATVIKLISKSLSEQGGDKGYRCNNEFKELIRNCCEEFLAAITSEANEISEKKKLRSIAGDHIVQALKDLGYSEYVDEVESAFKEYEQEEKKRPTKAQRRKMAIPAGMTQEELIAQQKALFESARKAQEK